MEKNNPKKLAAEKSVHKEQEPGVISNEMLTKAIIEQGHKGEAGRLARMDEVRLESITVIRLEFQNILKIDHLWVLKNLEILSLAFNKIDKIENLHRLTKLKELNLSFNFINKIENLDQLILMRTLSLFGNRIEKLENLDRLENLVIFSAGKNNINTLEGLERLRFLKNLRSLNLAENPISTNKDKPLRLYLASLLPHLKYYQYVLIKAEEGQSGQELFTRELQEILENEKFEIIERDRLAKEKADEVYLSKSFVEHLNGHQLFESLFTGDPDGEALLCIGEDALELKTEYMTEAYTFTQQIYKIGLGQFERRQQEIQLYNRCIEIERKKAQKLGQDIINHFLEVYNRLCPKVKKIVTDLSRDTLKRIESGLSSPSSIHTIQPFLDELELAKDEFNSIFEDSWHTLMSIEMQLFERTEEGNSNFENTIKEMTNEFIELAQAQFVLLREAEINFSDALIGIVQQYVTFKAASGYAGDIPEALQEEEVIRDVPSQKIPTAQIGADCESHCFTAYCEYTSISYVQQQQIPIIKIVQYHHYRKCVPASLDDKDVIINLAAGMRDHHMQLIDAREDKLINRSRNWVRELCDGLQKSEIKRNRAKVLEITYFLDHHRQLFYGLIDDVIPAKDEKRT